MMGGIAKGMRVSTSKRPFAFGTLSWIQMAVGTMSASPTRTVRIAISSEKPNVLTKSGSAKTLW